MLTFIEKCCILNNGSGGQEIATPSKTLTSLFWITLLPTIIKEVYLYDKEKKRKSATYSRKVR